MKDILKITVLLGGRIVVTLQMTPERNRCVFEYDKDWIAGGFSISPWELPLQTGLIYSKENSFGGGFAAFKDHIAAIQVEQGLKLHIRHLTVQTG